MKSLPTASRKGFRRFPIAGGTVDVVGAARPRLRLVERPVTERAAEGELVSLSRREAGCRLWLGRVAAAFLARGGHHRLGFARLGDYTRERLGLSGREVQGLASVASRLAELPAIEAAFLAGELTWSHVRLLAAAATPERETEWLGRARVKTVRALLQEIRDGGGDSPARDARALAEVVDDETGAIDGEETARVRIRCPARVRVLWRRTVELARRMLGAQAPVWQAAEAIAAEGMSAAPTGGGRDERAPAAGTSASGSSALSATSFGLRESSAHSLRPEEAELRSPAVGSTAPLPAGGGTPITGAASISDAGSIANAASSADVGSIVGAASVTGTASIASAGTVEGFGSTDGAGTTRCPDAASVWSPYGDDLATLDAFGLDERMREIVRVMQQIDVETGAGLRRFLDLKLHRSLGYSSFESFVRDRLGMSASRAWALVRIDRKAAEDPALGGAWRSGALSWTRVQTILPVLGTKPLPGVEPCPGAAPSFGGEEGATGAAAWIELAGSVTVRGLADEVDRTLDAVDLQMCARPGEEAADREVAFRGPASVVGLFREAVAAFGPHGGPGGSPEPAEAAQPAWKGLERLLEHVCQEWTSQPRHRDPVFERDGWRCAVPACSSRRNLHDHHRQHRSRGGGNERSNRVSTCAWHHLRGIHGGLVGVDGTAPDGLTWRLGLRPGREALLVLEGDRYLKGL